MLVASGSTIVAIAPDATRARLLTDAQDAAYSPDGTMIAFARSGDLWTANADGSGQRRLESTPKVEEWGPSWSPDGHVLVYSARVGGQRQIRLVQLPAGPTTRIAPSDAEEWSPTFSRNGRLAFVSSRGGTPAVYTSAARREEHRALRRDTARDTARGRPRSRVVTRRQAARVHAGGRRRHDESRRRRRNDAGRPDAAARPRRASGVVAHRIPGRVRRRIRQPALGRGRRDRPARAR